MGTPCKKVDLESLLNVEYKIIHKTESLIIAFKAIFFLRNNLCEILTSTHKNKRLFCIKKKCFKIFNIQKQIRLVIDNPINTHLRIKILITQYEYLTLNN